MDHAACAGFRPLFSIALRSRVNAARRAYKGLGLSPVFTVRATSYTAPRDEVARKGERQIVFRFVRPYPDCHCVSSFILPTIEDNAIKEMLTFGLAFLIGNLCAAQEIPRTEVYLRYSFVRAKSAISVPAFTANHVQLIERFALSAVLGCYVILLTGASQYFQKLCQLLQRYTFPGKLEPAC